MTVEAMPFNERHIPFQTEADVVARMSAPGLPSKFEWKRLLLLRGGYVGSSQQRVIHISRAAAANFPDAQVARAAAGG